jgi:hypothetical protein
MIARGHDMGMFEFHYWCNFAFIEAAFELMAIRHSVSLNQNIAFLKADCLIWLFPSPGDIPPYDVYLLLVFYCQHVHSIAKTTTF